MLHTYTTTKTLINQGFFFIVELSISTITIYMVINLKKSIFIYEINICAESQNILSYKNTIKNGFKVTQNTVAIAAYNKYEQMIHPEEYFNKLAFPSTILRFEIQTEYLKIHNLRKDNNIVCIKDFLSKSQMFLQNLRE